MCGIAGQLALAEYNRIDEAELTVMVMAMTHRGPDDEGIYLDRNHRIGLGTRWGARTVHVGGILVVLVEWCDAPWLTQVPLRSARRTENLGQQMNDYSEASMSGCL